ncbi:MAG: peptide-methionine (S)-S-oxide reductase MsrA [Patescibacteria group bacterium]|nr:peptide-methionine (S)-S-oxide reductase MsrA [Patescibacteria group bacterium]MDE2172357.1 peptide-methionine (S)-S-oxide reductase MsrA [Patescibacteria group bacterium]
MVPRDTAVFGGGCFWCTEAVFSSLKGVISVMPGYTGGRVANPTYEQVCAGATGHIEAIKIEFDPSVISYDDLLAVFFNTHDPTTRDRQGNDVGEQYASAIFYNNESQKAAAETFISDIQSSHAYDKPVVTVVRPLEEFYAAEDYHQKYYETHKDAPYCQIVIEPKLEKLQNRFAQLLKHE